MNTEEFKQELLKLHKQIDDLVRKYVTEPEEHIQEVNQEYLSQGDTKVLLVIPTEKKLEDKLPSDINKIIIPTGVQIKYYNVFGLPVAEAYNNAVQVLLNDGADYMLTVEDDTYAPYFALSRLLDILRENKHISAVGAWYPKKSPLREGVHIVLKHGITEYRTASGPDDGLHEVMTLAMGCTLYKAEMFKYITSPWFATTENLTQDSFFSQKARKMGYKLYCDSNTKCKHIDRITGEVFE